MNALEPFIKFMSVIPNDARIGTTHMALYVALYDLWLENNQVDCVDLTVSQVMKRAKILARSTFVRAMRDLHEWGYLVYLPSYDNRVKSKVLLKTKNDGDGNSEQTGFSRIQK